MWTWLLVSCASWFGLSELDALPTDFPLDVDVETGHITSPVVHDDAEVARATGIALRAQAEARGFVVAEERREKKRERVVMTGPDGRIELGCCPQRADRRHLVLITWWPQAPSP